MISRKKKRILPNIFLISWDSFFLHNPIRCLGPDVRGTRPVLVTFESFKDRDEVLRKARMLKERIIFLLYYCTKHISKILSICHKLKVPLSLQHDDINFWYLKLRWFDLTEFIIQNIKGLRHLVEKILVLENQSLLQRLNLFFFQNTFLYKNLATSSGLSLNSFGV